MSSARDLLQFADRHFSRKIEEERYQDAKNLQLMQIADKKKKENQIVQSQRIFNDLTRTFSQSGWDEDGKWVGYSHKSPDAAVDAYLTQMDKEGLAGDAANAYQMVNKLKSESLIKAGQELTSKLKNWETVNAKKFGTDDWIPWNETFEKEKKKYLKSIGADKLYMELLGAGGEMMTAQATGLTAKDFEEKGSSWLTPAGIGTGAVAVGGAVVAAKKGKFKPLMDMVKGKIFKSDKIANEAQKLLTGRPPLKRLPMPPIMPPTNMTKAYKPVYEQIVRKHRAGDTKGAQQILDRFKGKDKAFVRLEKDLFGKGNQAANATRKASDSVAKNTTSKEILDAAKNIDKKFKLGDSKTAKIAGTVALGAGAYHGGDAVSQNLMNAVSNDPAVIKGDKSSKAAQVGGIVGGTAAVATLPAVIKGIGKKVNEKGMSWAIKKVMEKGGKGLALRFAAKAAGSGIAGAFTGGLATAGTVGFLALDAYAIAQILSEEE